MIFYIEVDVEADSPVELAEVWSGRAENGAPENKYLTANHFIMEKFKVLSSEQHLEKVAAIVRMNATAPITAHAAP